MNGDSIVPFYIAPGPVGVGAIVSVSPDVLSSNVRGHLELQVISGGPVFLYEGRLDASEAYNRSHTAIDFDLAAAVGGGPFKKTINQGAEGILTLHADNESIGYLRFIYAN